MYDRWMIVGIDEVGRGAWAGPLVVGAVVLGDARTDGLTDSKKLTRKARERLAARIRREAAGVGLGWVSARQVDSLGLGQALRLGARRAVAALRCEYSEIIIDGTVRLIDGDNVTTLAKADLLIPAVSAASIVAKVARDAYMTRLDGVFDGYGFAGHVGYGTAAHQAALRVHGVLPVHRESFAPVAALTGGSVGKSVAARPATIGARAEDAAADYLAARGHAIRARNWKTPRCEIDIVSVKDGVLYFTEVKYRRQGNQGGGVAALTPEKLARMAYASETYVARAGLGAAVRRLSAIAMTGEPPRVESYFESV